MAKKEKIKFYPTQEQLMHSRFCHEIDIAVCIEAIPGRYGYYWVEKHFISDFKKKKYMRIDLTKKDTPSNRAVFNEIDAYKKVFEMYKMVYDKKK